jgi:hypothetical protein
MESFEQHENGLFLSDRNPIRERSDDGHLEKITVAPDTEHKMPGVEVEWYSEGIDRVYFGEGVPDELYNRAASRLVSFGVRGETATDYISYTFSLSAGAGAAFYWSGLVGHSRRSFHVCDARPLLAAATELHAINQAASS